MIPFHYAALGCRVQATCNADTPRTIGLNRTAHSITKSGQLPNNDYRRNRHKPKPLSESQVSPNPQHSQPFSCRWRSLNSVCRDKGYTLQFLSLHPGCHAGYATSSPASDRHTLDRGFFAYVASLIVKINKVQMACVFLSRICFRSFFIAFFRRFAHRFLRNHPCKLCVILFMIIGFPFRIEGKERGNPPPFFYSGGQVDLPRSLKPFKSFADTREVSRYILDQLTIFLNSGIRANMPRKASIQQRAISRYIKSCLLNLIVRTKNLK